MIILLPLLLENVQAKGEKSSSDYLDLDQPPLNAKSKAENFHKKIKLGSTCPLSNSLKNIETWPEQSASPVRISSQSIIIYI